jgi:hypothetical protein
MLQGNARAQTIRLSANAEEIRLLRRCLWSRAVGVNETYRHLDFSGAPARGLMRRERAWLTLRDQTLHPGEMVLPVEDVRRIAAAVAWSLQEHANGRAIQDREHGLARVDLTPPEVVRLSNMRIALSTEAHCLQKEAPR